MVNEESVSHIHTVGTDEGVCPYFSYYMDFSQPFVFSRYFASRKEKMHTDRGSRRIPVCQTLLQALVPNRLGILFPDGWGQDSRCLGLQFPRLGNNRSIAAM